MVVKNLVTTHMGGVDWNQELSSGGCISYVSPPTWVVWIEITPINCIKHLLKVTTHMGGVDWNPYLYH